MLDEQATDTLRRDMAASASNEFFGHSPGRMAHEKVWTRSLYEKLTDLLWQLPVNWRFYIKHQLMGTVATLDVEDISPAHLETAFDGLLQEHPQLRARVERARPEAGRP